MKKFTLVIVSVFALAVTVVAYGAAPAPVVTVDSITDHSVTLGSLKCGTTYEFRTRQRVNSAWSTGNFKTVTTSACAPPPPPPPAACADGIDNDGDGLIDFPADPGCTSATDTDETNVVAGSEPAPIAGLGYHQVFRDDFNGTAIDSSSWVQREFWEDPPRPGAVVVSNGTAKINNARPYVGDQSITTGPDTSGGPIKHAWTYGYFEARMKFTDAQGSWPAFWLESVANSQGTLCPTLNFELDIMEYQGDEPNTFYGTEHRDTNSNCGVGDTTRPNVWPQPKKLAGDWHTFAITWTPTTIMWYVDGVQMSSATTFDSGNQPMYMTFTMQACGWDNTNACTTSTPDPLTTEVDYVQVWQK